MKRKTIRQSLLFKLFACLFIVSAAFSVIPSNSIGIFGFFGEITSVAVQTESVEIVKVSHIPHLISNHIVQKQNQRENSTFQLIMPCLEWLALFALLILVIYIAYSYSLPNAWNLISFKVRLDD